MTAPLVYTVKPPPPETFAAGDRVHELKTDKIYVVAALDADQVKLIHRLTGEPRTLTRAAFDEAVVYGREGMRVFGKVYTAVTPG